MNTFPYNQYFILYFFFIYTLIISINVNGKKTNDQKIGFTIGKFAPFHKGHQFLIETGLKEMDKFIVFVYDTKVIDIPSEQRAKWIKDRYPNVEIRIAKNPPKKFGMDPESIKLQMDYLRDVLGNTKVTHFYSSEKYGGAVAKNLGIIDRRVDNERLNVPISATKIRGDLNGNKQYLDDEVYQDYIKYKQNKNNLN